MKKITIFILFLSIMFGGCSNSALKKNNEVNNINSALKKNNERSNVKLEYRNDKYVEEGKTEPYTGTRKIYNSNVDSKVIVEKNYKDGQLDGTYTIYYDTKENTKSEYFYKNGKQEKDYKLYYKDGKIEQGTRFEGNKLVTYSSGFKNKEVTYKDLKPNGEAISYYYRTDKINFIKNYTSGKLNGKATGYYENGAKKYEEVYVDDKLDGKVVWYYKNGDIKSEEFYVDGNPEGRAVWYYEGGVVKVDGIYVNGKLKSKYSDKELKKMGIFLKEKPLGLAGQVATNTLIAAIGVPLAVVTLPITLPLLIPMMIACGGSCDATKSKGEKAFEKNIAQIEKEDILKD